MCTDVSQLSRDSFLTPPLLRPLKARPKGVGSQQARKGAGGVAIVQGHMHWLWSPRLFVIRPGTLPAFLLPYCISSWRVPFMALERLCKQFTGLSACDFLCSQRIWSCIFLRKSRSVTGRLRKCLGIGLGGKGAGARVNPEQKTALRWLCPV